MLACNTKKEFVMTPGTEVIHIKEIIIDHCVSASKGKMKFKFLIKDKLTPLLYQEEPSYVLPK